MSRIARQPTRLMAAITQPITSLMAGAVLFTALAGTVAARIAGTYLQHYPYFYDPVGNQLYGVKVFDRLSTSSRLAVAAQEWVINLRFPLRTVPAILLAPQSLVQPLGHLFTALPMLGVFLLLLGWTIYRRTGNRLYAVTAMLLFASTRGMFNPTDGLAAYWLDLPAAFLAGSAALCLLNSNGGRSLGWLAVFAVLAACTALSRYIAGLYVFVMCAPVLAVYLFQRWRQEKQFWNSVAKPLLLVGGLVTLLAGYFLVAHFKDNVDFYANYAYANGNGMSAASLWTVSSLYRFINSRVTLGLLAGLFLVSLVFAFIRQHPLPASKPSASAEHEPASTDSPGQRIELARPAAWEWTNQVALVWLAAAHVLFSSLVLQVTMDWRTPLYAWPMLFLLLVSPAPWQQRPWVHWAGNLVALGVGVVAVFFGWRYATAYYAEAQQPPAALYEQKTLYVELGHELARIGNRLVWVPFFDTVAPMPQAEAYYDYGALTLSPSRQAGKTLFNNTAPQTFIWQLDYPGLGPDEVSRAIYADMARWADVVIVFNNPQDSDGRFQTDYATSVARYMATEVQSNAQWHKVFTVNSAQYGQLAGYRNLAPQTGAYQWLLWRYAASLP